MTADTYRCAWCHGVFTNERPEADVAAELRATFPETHDTGPTEVVCDDCFKRMMASDYPPSAYEADVRAGRIQTSDRPGEATS